MNHNLIGETNEKTNVQRCWIKTNKERVPEQVSSMMGAEDAEDVMVLADTSAVNDFAM